MKEHCENEWLCHLCGRKLKTKRNLINHYFVHTGEKPFNCNDCGKVFTCKDKLKLHLKIHKGIRPHVCLVCNKAFIQKGHLASHSKSHVSTPILMVTTTLLIQKFLFFVLDCKNFRFQMWAMSSTIYESHKVWTSSTKSHWIRMWCLR